ncbi:MAG TPA: IPTL-CTERM sorting domain-containing protein [Xanthomonadales bacterium]|nr:IPTL-CTERM sorting domain-containing protein [Xanthomonadales bacterium]
MRHSKISLAIAAALIVSSPAIAQEKIPANGTAPSGSPFDSVLQVSSLPGVTCQASTGTNCPSATGAITNTTPVTSTFDLAGCETVNDLNVGLDISHTWVGDLRVTLTAPDATSVVIMDRPGVPASAFGCLSDDVLAVLSDSGTGPVENTCLAGPAIAGTLTPNNPLSAFNGLAGNGSWSLLVEDLIGGDNGTLNDWSLDPLCSGDPTVSRATFLVTKDFTDDNPGEVTVSLDCNTGLILDQSKQISEGESVEFVITEFTDGALNCTVTEEVPAGYSAEYLSGGSSSTEGCEFESIGFGDAFRCNVVNTPEPVTLTVNKTWLYPGSGVSTDERYYLLFYCNAEIEGGYNPDGNNWYYDLYAEGDGSSNITVHPTWQGNSCSVSEDPYSDFVESDASDCQDVDIELGSDTSCEVINTVFYEGIPTLSHYGIAVLALSLLGLGVAGFRRYS